jgi:hypothetical protein
VELDCGARTIRDPPNSISRRRAAEERDELALVHSITSSARASSLSGIWLAFYFSLKFN